MAGGRGELDGDGLAHLKGRRRVGHDDNRVLGHIDGGREGHRPAGDIERRLGQVVHDLAHLGPCAIDQLLDRLGRILHKLGPAQADLLDAVEELGWRLDGLHDALLEPGTFAHLVAIDFFHVRLLEIEIEKKKDFSMEYLAMVATST